jgi:anti-sigma B factor antagonist
MFTIEHESVRQGMVRITVAGKLMLGAESHQVENLVERLLEEGQRDFVFNLGGLTHIDSTGIGRFIASYNRIMQVDGASMRMAGATGAVRAAFRVTKLDSVFPFFESLAQAEA